MADKEEKKKGNKFVKRFFLFVFVIIVGFGLALVVSSYLHYGSITFDTSLLYEPEFLAIFGLAIIVYVLYRLSSLMKEPKENSKAKVTYKGGKDKYYKVDWLSVKELETNKKYMYHTFEELSRTDDMGTPIRADFLDKKNLKINMYPECHTIIIGTTGSGKSTQVVYPYVQILSKLKSKPCLIISDPKGEIYQFNINHLKKMGYKVVVFDMLEPFFSTCWNPLTRPYRLYHKAQGLKKEVVIHRSEDPRQTKLQLAGREYSNEWFEFDGVAFADMESVNRRVESQKQRLETEAFADLKELAMVLSPVKGQDPIWSSGAKDFINALLIAMLEDTVVPETGMTEEKFNLFNAYQIANIRDADPYNPFKTITEYFRGRSTASTAPQLANQVLSNAPETKQSYFGFISDALGAFADKGVSYATSKNEMKLENFTDEPTVLFIKVPDQEKHRHAIVSIFIAQLYKVLVEIASRNKPKQALKRQVHFILDEFANIPKIPDFETTITVSRGRNIFWTLILQSYSQLSNRYEDRPAGIIRENCNIHIYIKASDPSTREEFSKLCGNTVSEMESTSSTKGKDPNSNGTNISLSVDQRPLIWPDELDTLPEGTNIVKIVGVPPIKAEFTRSYKVDKYDLKPAEEGYREQGYLDVNNILFDVVARNRAILRKDIPKTGLDDIDFGF